MYIHPRLGSVNAAQQTWSRTRDQLGHFNATHCCQQREYILLCSLPRCSTLYDVTGKKWEVCEWTFPPPRSLPTVCPLRRQPHPSADCCSSSSLHECISIAQVVDIQLLATLGLGGTDWAGTQQEGDGWHPSSSSACCEYR